MNYNHHASQHQPVSRAELERVAKLVRIKIDDGEVDSYCQHLGAVVSWFGMLSEVDTSEVDAAIHGKAPEALPVREDIVVVGDIRDHILTNAPETDMGFFVVKNVLK